MKKYRIIQHPNGKYRVQYKDGFFEEWKDEYISYDDFPSWNICPSVSKFDYTQDGIDRYEGVFSTFKLAQAKVDKCIAKEREYVEKERQRKLMKKFKVIEVKEV